MNITSGLPVTDWVLKWRSDGEKYTAKALREVCKIKIKDKTTGRRSDGSGRFRPSMIGNPCPRAQVLSYLGFEQAEGVSAYEQMAHTGSELHYAWQEQGLSAGWLTGVEVEIDLPRWFLRGQADGQCIDGSVFELKTMGSDKYWGKGRWNSAKPVSKWDYPVAEHVRQVHAYMEALEVDEASIVYLDRDSNDFREFRVLFDTDLYDEMNEFVNSMISHVDEKKLPEILPVCQSVMDELTMRDPFTPTHPRLKTVGARQFSFCNYREVCQNAQYPKGL